MDFKKSHKIETQEIKPFNKYIPSVSPIISRHFSITKPSDNISPGTVPQYCSVIFLATVKFHYHLLTVFLKLLFSTIPIPTIPFERDNWKR